MKILITGANGFLGKNLYQILRKEHTILTFDSFTNFLSDPEKLSYNQKINSCDCIIHAAGLAHTDINSVEHFKINYEGTKTLINRVKTTSNIKAFIFISSVSVYGLTNGSSISEEVLCKPNCAYGKSKLNAENYICDFFKNSEVNYVILRLPLLVGSPPIGNFKTLIKAIKGKRYVQIGNGSVEKSILSVQDIGKNFAKIIEVRGIYNLTDGYNIKIKVLNEIIKRKTNGNYIIVNPSIIKPIFLLGEFLKLRKINLSTYQKLTKELTFSDKKAQKEMNWSPTSVINYLNNDW